MLKEFRQFILRGNLVDLAVAVVVGAAFTALVNTLVSAIFTPLIAAIFGKHDFSNLSFTINASHFAYGRFINALITFVLVSAVLFFVVIKPVNALLARLNPDTAVDKETRACPECLSAIPTEARRCAFCTAEVSAAA